MKHKKGNVFNYRGIINALIVLCLIIFLTESANAFSIRSLGMGDVYPATARDPSGLFYNPAYLARADAVRAQFDNLSGPIPPQNNIAVSVGDLGFAGQTTGLGKAYQISQGFNTYSFLRVGAGIKFLNGKKDFDAGFDADLTKNYALSFAVLNEEGSFLPRKYSLNLAYKTEDGDKCLAVNHDLNGNIRIGYENQFTSKAFWRVGYNADHPTAGFTWPLNQNVDIDLALDMQKESAKGLFGVALFRNTENKRINSNHSINFGKAIVGEDKFITIEGFNIHYVDSGAGYPLVLIGGGIHFTHHWDPYIEELSKHFRVINIDHLGAGESDKPNYFFGYTVEEQAELINELLRRIGIKEAYLLGYCYGGSVAFYLAGEYPDKYKKLVEIEGFTRGINTIPIAERDKYRDGAVLMRHDVEYLNAYLMKDFVVYSFRLDYPYFSGKMWYQLNKAVLYIDLREQIKEMKAPVLYYAGTKSWAYEFLGPTKDYIKANIKDLKYIEIEGAGHDVDRFDQQTFIKQVIEFLTRS